MFSLLGLRQHQIAGERVLPYAKPMTAQYNVRLFRNGRSQAIRIPREFELPGNDAIIRREDGRLIIESAPSPSLLTLLSGLQPIIEDFGPLHDLPAEPFDL